MDRFRRAAPVTDWAACWAIDPAQGPVIVELADGRIVLDGEVVATYAGDTISPASSVEGRLLVPLYDRLFDVFNTHQEATERHPCAPPATGEYLIEADASVSQAVLTTIMVTAANARYGDAWLRVRSARQLPTTQAPRTPDPRRGVERCVQHWVLQLQPSGEVIATRHGEPSVTVAALEGAVDIDQTVALLSQPDWAQTTVAVMPSARGDAQQLATAFAALPARLPHRLTIAMSGWGWRSGRTHTWSPAGIDAVPISLGGPPGECIFASREPTCQGLDGQRHAWIGDPCWNRSP